MSKDLYTTPHGMSYVNAFRALWENSRPALFFQLTGTSDASQAELVATAEKIETIFQQHKKQHVVYFDYVGGRLIKTDFSKFPQLHIGSYDRAYGCGAAEKAIQSYHNRIANKKIDPDNFYDFQKIIPAEEMDD